jgi:response regulator NasT
MDKIVVAFENENNRKRVCDILEASGIPVKVSCRSGAEAIRAIRKMSGGIVISGFKLSEMTAADLAYDLNGVAMVLAVRTAAAFGQCISDNIFKLPTPFSRGDLVSSVRMLLQMQEKHYRAARTRRSEKDTGDISKAKEILMSKNRYDGGEAHRFIQRREYGHRHEGG